MIPNLIFINVNPNNENIVSSEVKSINIYDVPYFKPLGKYYAETEVIFNVYLNPILINDYDYLGFIHYDMDISNYSFDDFSLLCRDSSLISFETHKFNRDFSAKILLDIKKPNKLYGRGKNCYYEIFNDYNLFYDRRFTPDMFLNQEKDIILCSSFLLERKIFDKLMDFISVILLSRKLNFFDEKHKYRIQGGIMERYFAVWFLLQDIPFVTVDIDHLFLKTNSQNSFIFKLINKIKSYL
jgi:hypothetical protein